MQKLTVIFQVIRTDKKVNDIRKFTMETQNMSTDWNDLYLEIFNVIEKQPEFNTETLAPHVEATQILEVKNEQGTLIHSHAHQLIKALLDREYGMEQMLSIEDKGYNTYRVEFIDSDGNTAFGTVAKKGRQYKMLSYGIE